MKFAAVCVFCLVACPWSVATAQVQRPNVIIVIADQLRYESCGYAGDSAAATPNIDRLATEGMSFDNYMLNSPEQTMAQATLWTGKYASTHGMIIGTLRLNPNHDTLGNLLTAKGYTCDYIGRWQLRVNHTGLPDSRKKEFSPTGPCRLGFDGLWAAGDLNQNNGNPIIVSDNSSRILINNSGSHRQLTDLAIGRLQQHAESKRPFAMVVSYFASVDTPTLDDQVGNLLRSVEVSGLSHNTIVMFTADQGARFDANTQHAKTSFRDLHMRVPMLIRWSGRIPSGRRSNACISTVDIMPTICGMLGVGYPGKIDGIDLSDATRVDCSCEPDFAFLQNMGHRSEWQDGFEWRAIRDQQFTYARCLADDAEYLFDNRSDSGQVTNLIAESGFANDLKRLRQWTVEKMLATQDQFKPCTWYRKEWTDGQAILRGARGEFHRDLGDDIPVDDQP